MENWNIEELTGYQPKTTFWQDFVIAEVFGVDAINATYKRAFNEWKNNAEYITELSMVLNWKCWRWWDKNPQLGELYKELFYKLDSWCLDHLKGEDLTYYIKTTD